MTKSHRAAKPHGELVAPVRRVSATHVASIWQRHIGPGAECTPLTSRDLGQLKSFIAATGDEALPAIEFALERWGTFASEVRIRRAVERVPREPNIGFIYRHWDVLVATMQRAQAREAKRHELQRQSRVTENSQSAAVIRRATAADIQEALAMLEARNR